jgi:Porin subfamily
MKMIKSLILGSTAGLIAMSGAQAADLPVKAKAVEYVKVCSLYGAGFWYIPGTDTCIRIGGAIRIDTAINGGIYDAPFWQGGASGSQAYNKDWYTTRSRFNLTEDTRTATEYGVLRTYANVQMDWTRGVSGIAGGAAVEVDYAFIQFAGFTFGKAVSEFDPQWALTKPSISSGFNMGSNDATGINQLAYTATFGNGVSGTISLEDAQPYRTAGVVNASTAIISPFAAGTLATGAQGVNNFTGNASAGDHVPDIVGNLRLDQAWGSLHFGAAAHEVHGTYFTAADSEFGKPGSTWGYALTGAFELKNLPTGAGDSFKADATFAHGAAKYVWGGTIDTAGAGRFARASGNDTPGTLAFGYVLDGVYSGLGTAASPGTSISLSNAWQVSAYYEHYWNPAWRTSLFGNYSQISYGGTSDALLIANLSSAALNPTGHFVATPGTNGGSMKFATAQIGTRTAWTPVKDLTISAEFIYTRLIQNLNGTFVNTSAVSGAAPGAVFGVANQNVYNGAVQILRSF